MISDFEFQFFCEPSKNNNWRESFSTRASVKSDLNRKYASDPRANIDFWFQDYVGWSELRYYGLLRNQSKFISVLFFQFRSLYRNRKWVLKTGSQLSNRKWSYLSSGSSKNRLTLWWNLGFPQCGRLSW